MGVLSVATTLGVSSRPATTIDKGVVKWSGTCDLPGDACSFNRLLVKDDAHPYASHLMENTQPMFFTIP